MAAPAIHSLADEDTRPRTLHVTLVGLLAHAGGTDRADQAIRAAATVLGLPAVNYAHQEVVEILEKVAETPGRLGVAARFLKIRYILSV